MTRRAKIVATLGPASSNREVGHALIAAGVDVFRLNFAHASPEEHRSAVRFVRTAAAEAGRSVGILADLPGPKLRTGPLVGGEVELVAGASFALGPGTAGDASGVSTSVPDLAEMVEIGATIYLADGAILLRVTTVDGAVVTTEVVRGGVLRSRKGMHLPDLEHRLAAFTPDDRVSVDLALELDVDLVGLSFVRTAEDIERVRQLLPADGSGPKLVAKIETRSAVENLDAILGSADAVMVARGDLGIQMALQDVPGIQKEIIATANAAAKPVITATQMLESMTRGPLPTRAEVSDVANAVLDGTDALMLSEETAVGVDPVAVVRTMAEIITSTESSPGEGRTPLPSDKDDPVSWAVASAAVQAAEELDVAAILCPTRSGSTARRVAAFRPRARIVGLAEDPRAFKSLALTWGVEVAPMPEPGAGTTLEERVLTGAVACGAVGADELAIIVAGAPGNRLGTTDFMKIVRTE